MFGEVINRLLCNTVNMLKCINKAISINLVHLHCITQDIVYKNKIIVYKNIVYKNIEAKAC